MPLVKLSKKPKNPVVIEGFPGFGLVGTIVTEFLLDHLKCEKIGTYHFPQLPSTVAIHAGKVVEPFSVHYNKKHNLVIIHSIAGTNMVEWDAADAVLDVCKQLNASQLISVEGVGSLKPDNEQVFYWTNDSAVEKKYIRHNMEALGEGIIVGVTGALLVKSTRKMSCLFAETHSKLPDAMAASKVIKVLNKIFAMKLDIKPLEKQAMKFEEKLKSLMAQSQQAQQVQGKKMTAPQRPKYFG